MKKFQSDKTLKRYNRVAIFFILVGILIVAKVVEIMFVKRDFWNELGERFVKENVPIPAQRGNILSADRQMLATSLPEYKIYMDFVVSDRDSLTRLRAQQRRDSVLEANMDSLAIGLNKLLPRRPVKWFKERLRTGKAKGSRHWAIYPYRISYVDYKEVMKLPFFREGKIFSGIHHEEFKDIKKPFGSLAARTLGDMYPGKDSARSGLQLSFDSLLRGTPGVTHRQKIRYKWLNIEDIPPVNGADIITTIDVKMQDYAENALVDMLKEINGIHGVVLLMEVATGDVKAIVNMSRCSDGVYREVKNTAVSNLMEPGSVFKPISFLVALNDGKIRMGQTVNGCGGQRMMYGRVMKDWNWHKGGYGMLTVSQCLEQSSNIGVSTLIDNNYHSDPEKFVRGLYKVGIAEDLKLDIPGYAVPRIRMPRKDKHNIWINWSNTALPWMSIGYETQVPPISILSFYNGVANGGRMMRPRFVTCAMRNNEIVREFPPQVVRESMASPQAIKDLQTCLRNVVQVGLGKRAGSRNFSVSGKTGTAQVWTKGGKTSGHLVSFTGYFPSEKPRYSCMVCIISNSPGASGGLHCAPVFKKVAEMAMAHTLKPRMTVDTLHKRMPVVDKGNLHYATHVLDGFGIRTRGSDVGEDLSGWGKAVTAENYVQFQTQALRTDIVPDLTGMGARDAVYYLERMGLKVIVDGFGTVQQQSLPFGHVVVKGETIRLKLGFKGYQSKDFVKDDEAAVPVSAQTGDVGGDSVKKVQ